MRLALIQGVAKWVFPVFWNRYRKIRLEQAMPDHPKTRKHRSAKDNVIQERRPFYVLYDVGFAGGF